jgi:hypothetical protein
VSDIELLGRVEDAAAPPAVDLFAEAAGTGDLRAHDACVAEVLRITMLRSHAVRPVLVVSLLLLFLSLT